jgi:hypothetical protein
MRPDRDNLDELFLKFISVSLCLCGDMGFLQTITFQRKPITCHNLDRAQATDNQELHPASGSQ